MRANNNVTLLPLKILDSISLPYASDPRKNTYQGFAEARLLGKISGEIFGCLKVGVLGHIFGSDHENIKFQEL